MKNLSGRKKHRSIFRRIVVLLMALLLLFMLAACHAPGYGNTSKCTICGKPATHSTGSYGYCNKHWKDATGQ